MEQRGFVSAYVLDEGNRAWLEVACTLGVSTALTFAIGLALLWHAVRKSIAEQMNRQQAGQDPPMT